MKQAQPGTFHERGSMMIGPLDALEMRSIDTSEAIRQSSSPRASNQRTILLTGGYISRFFLVFRQHRGWSPSDPWPHYRRQLSNGRFDRPRWQTIPGRLSINSDGERRTRWTLIDDHAAAWRSTAISMMIRNYPARRDHRPPEGSTRSVDRLSPGFHTSLSLSLSLSLSFAPCDSFNNVRSYALPPSSAAAAAAAVACDTHRKGKREGVGAVYVRARLYYTRRRRSGWKDDHGSAGELRYGPVWFSMQIELFACHYANKSNDASRMYG